ncbi:MAG: discoidin domain-containing protein, partial [Chloroflexota bacterium]
SRKRCYLHPHRPAEQKCNRCKTCLCEECVHEFQGQYLCEHCLEELDFIEATRPTFADHVRGFFHSLRNTVIAIVVIGAICGGLFYAFRGLMDQPITPEQMARFRYAASGSFQTADGINVNSTVLGASVASFTSQRKGYEATHVINEYSGPDYPGWRSADATFPQDFVVAQQNLSAVSKVILTQQPNEPLNTWAKDFEIQASSEGPNRGFVTIGQWQLRPVAGPQKFTFKATPSKWLRLRILSNYGSGEYTSLAEFDAYVVPANPLGAPGAAGAPTP